MSMEVYMYFDGNAREALDFYSSVFSAEKKDVMTYDDMANDEKNRDLILNASLIIQGTYVMFSDVDPDMTDTPLIKGNAITLVINDDNKEYIEVLFDKLSEEGKIEMELGETFWSKMFGSVCDKFGNTWELNYSGE